MRNNSGNTKYIKLTKTKTLLIQIENVDVDDDTFEETLKEFYPYDPLEVGFDETDEILGCTLYNDTTGDLASFAAELDMLEEAGVLEESLGYLTYADMVQFLNVYSEEGFARKTLH